MLSEAMRLKLYLEPQNLDSQTLYEQSLQQNIMMKQMKDEYEKMIKIIENKDKEIVK